MTNSDAAPKKNKRLTYEPPRAVRLDAVHQGAGACSPGSGDVTGGGCSTGFSPGFSKCQSGSAASASKCQQGDSAGGQCVTGGSPGWQCVPGSAV